MPVETFGARLFRLLANAVTGSEAVSRNVTAATLSVVQTILELLDSHFVPDVRRIKESLIQKTEAETQTAIAESKKRMSEAAEAANRADLPKRKDAMAKAELERIRVENAKTQAEVDAIRSDTEARRLQAMVDAKVKLMDAISRLRQAGGEIQFDQENLNALLTHELRSIPGSGLAPHERDEPKQ